MKFLILLVVASSLDSAAAVQKLRGSESLALTPIDSLVEFPQIILLDETTGENIFSQAGGLSLWLSPLRGCTLGCTDIFLCLFSETFIDVSHRRQFCEPVSKFDYDHFVELLAGKCYGKDKKKCCQSSDTSCSYVKQKVKKNNMCVSSNTIIKSKMTIICNSGTPQNQRRNAHSFGAKLSAFIQCR